MPRATIASRQLKNKDTGIDLVVPSYKEIKGLMSSTVYYQVVLVSNLACFKTPSHKESDVVQYSIERQWNEFEELRTKVSELFHGTVLPILNKKSIIVNDNVLRERRNNLDHFLKFLASVSKLAKCAPILEFLGVDSGRARRFNQGETLESIQRPSDDNKQEERAEANEPEAYVFEDSLTDETDGYLFDNADEDEDLFGADSSRVQVSMFEQQDMKRELSEEDEKDFGFIPDGIITKRETIRVGFDESEDNSDLFVIEDNLDKLMTVDVGKKEKKPESKKEDLLPPSPSTVKPKTPTKPSTAPKPRLSSKPDIVKSSTSQEDSETYPREPLNKPTPANRPKPAPKPQQRMSHQDITRDHTSAEKSSSSETVSSKTAKDSHNIDKLDQDDIMNYLRENSSTATDDVDLFS
uniref:PX domain-containing protein n=1 Tax=Arion vulgaris TaxID=1028688 RepID=A0A0B6Y7J8_9EUPU